MCVCVKVDYLLTRGGGHGCKRRWGRGYIVVTCRVGCTVEEEEEEGGEGMWRASEGGGGGILARRGAVLRCGEFLIFFVAAGGYW